MPLWTIEHFVDRLDAWVALEQPTDGLRQLVTTWIFSRVEDPYEGVRREPGFDNLWYGAVPGSAHGAEQIVGRSYWIDERRRLVQTDSFASLSRPI